jgi:hypothetical protein
VTPLWEADDVLRRNGENINPNITSHFFNELVTTCPADIATRRR